MATKHYEFIVNKIDAAKRRATELAKGLNHRGIEGQLRELAAKECIEPFMTQSYFCGTGKVIDSTQALSDQMDLVVYHRKIVPPILFSQELGLFPVECVRYVIEVKSTVTATEIRDAVKKFKTVRDLKSFPKIDKDGRASYGPLPTTVLFGFSSDIQGSEIARFLKYVSDPYPECIALCVLGKGYWFYSSENKHWYGKDTSSVDPIMDAFSMFITGFMNTLAGEECSIRPFNPGSYVREHDFLLPPVSSQKGSA
ncbi:DUF6602 domain-containing protein [Herbaspirillum sp. NPDC087042]|uniref:DUF6602 domain-containing protein n=1 Tax=Herbaspirillum sp. NPDC087042 TaxID=3364004 RepID=UPI003830BDEF